MNDVLSNYAGQIRAEHDLAKSKFREGTQHAINCGTYLAEVKAQLPHGEFSDWVRVHCRFSNRMAQIYMRLAAKAQRVPHLSIRQAIESIAQPRPERRYIESSTQFDAEWSAYLASTKSPNPYRFMATRSNDPEVRAAAAFSAEVWDLAPGVEPTSTGMSIPDGVNVPFENYQAILRLLVSKLPPEAKR